MTSAFVFQATTSSQCNSFSNRRKCISSDVHSRSQISQVYLHESRGSFRFAHQQRRTNSKLLCTATRTTTPTASGQQLVIPELGPAFESLGGKSLLDRRGRTPSGGPWEVRCSTSWSPDTRRDGEFFLPSKAFMCCSSLKPSHPTNAIPLAITHGATQLPPLILIPRDARPSRQRSWARRT
eukprot:1181831-Prorocentrum_minimum.AAC.2